MTGTVYRWELEKLTALWRVRLAVLISLVGPVLATFVLHSQQQVPSDTLFGRWVHESGASVPLVILSFVTQYAVPLLVGLVAGDIFASEDHYGTWKLILTRTPGRGAVFAGKACAAATYTLVIMVLLGLSSTLSGLLIVGRQPLVGLSGQMIPASHASELALYSWASALPPALGFTALGLLFSIVTRSGPAGIIAPVVVGGLMEVYSLVGTAGVIRVALLSTPFDAWHGLLGTQSHYRAMEHGLVTSAVYIVVCLTAGYVWLRRRDFNEG